MGVLETYFHYRNSGMTLVEHASSSPDKLRALGADGVDVDLCSTRDGALVVDVGEPDAEVERTSTDTGTPARPGGGRRRGGRRVTTKTISAADPSDAGEAGGAGA